MNRCLISFAVFLSLHSIAFAAANEVIPYTVKSIERSSGGFLELMGPGKMVVKGRVVNYRRGKYVRASNIHSLSAIEGISDGCVLHYASYDFSENITVRQSCKQLLQVVGNEAPKSAGLLEPKLKIE